MQANAMERKTRFQPGDPVTAFTGEAGLVLSAQDLALAREQLKEGKKPGCFFAPGCCHNPDYIIQIPVLFEDGTYDVMRSMNVRGNPELPEETRARIQGLLRKGREARS